MGSTMTMIRLQPMRTHGHMCVPVPTWLAYPPACMHALPLPCPPACAAGHLVSEGVVAPLRGQHESYRVLQRSNDDETQVHSSTHTLCNPSSHAGYLQLRTHPLCCHRNNATKHGEHVRIAQGCTLLLQSRWRPSIQARTHTCALTALQDEHDSMAPGGIAAQLNGLSMGPRVARGAGKAKAASEQEAPAPAPAPGRARDKERGKKGKAGGGATSSAVAQVRHEEDDDVVGAGRKGRGTRRTRDQDGDEVDEDMGEGAGPAAGGSPVPISQAGVLQSMMGGEPPAARRCLHASMMPV